MAEVRSALPKPVTVVVTIAAAVAIVGTAYRLDRAYERWLTQMDPLTKPRARLRQLKDGYRGRRADMSDLGHLIFDVLDEIDHARGGTRTL